MAGKPLELRISFEGNVPGLAEERLSIAAFAEPLSRLLRAYRRIASGLISDALDRPGYGERGGKYADEAARIDLELEQVTANSPLALSFACTIAEPGPQISFLQPDVLERAGKMLLDDIEAEGSEQLRHARVREYLESLPIGLTRQSYDLRRNGQSIRTVELSTVQLAKPPQDLPTLVSVSGELVGAAFPPAASEIKIKHEGGTLSVSATPEQVDRAIEMRHQILRALAVRGKGARLLRLGAASEPEPSTSRAEVVSRIDTKWADLLKRLAQ